MPTVTELVCGKPLGHGWSLSFLRSLGQMASSLWPLIFLCQKLVQVITWERLHLPLVQEVPIVLCAQDQKSRSLWLLISFVNKSMSRQLLKNISAYSYQDWHERSPWVMDDLEITRFSTCLFPYEKRFYILVDTFFSFLYENW